MGWIYLNPKYCEHSLFPRVFSGSSWSQASRKKFLGFSRSWWLSGPPFVDGDSDCSGGLRPTLFLVWALLEVHCVQASVSSTQPKVLSLHIVGCRSYFSEIMGITEWVIFKFYQDFPGNNGLGILSTASAVLLDVCGLYSYDLILSPNDRPIRL